MLPYINFNIIVWFRSACNNNEQHNAEVDSARTAAEKDVTKKSDEIIQQIDRELSFLPITVSFFHLNEFVGMIISPNLELMTFL